MIFWGERIEMLEFFALPVEYPFWEGSVCFQRSTLGGWRGSWRRRGSNSDGGAWRGALGLSRGRGSESCYFGGRCLGRDFNEVAKTLGRIASVTLTAAEYGVNDSAALAGLSPIRVTIGGPNSISLCEQVLSLMEKRRHPEGQMGMTGLTREGPAIDCTMIGKSILFLLRLKRSLARRE